MELKSGVESEGTLLIGLGRLDLILMENTRLACALEMECSLPPNKYSLGPFLPPLSQAQAVAGVLI